MILTKHLTDLGQMWPKYLPLAPLAYNTFNTSNLANYSPYELVFCRKPKLLLDLETAVLETVETMILRYLGHLKSITHYCTRDYNVYINYSKTLCQNDEV